MARRDLILISMLLLLIATSSRMLNFSSYSWYVRAKNADPLGPGPNYFDNSTDFVWVDDTQHLHLKIKINSEGHWSCSEIFSTLSFGYGSYVFNVEKGFEMIDPAAVGGLFTYLDDSHEIDVQLSQWLNPNIPNTQYVVQPHTISGNVQRFDMVDKQMSVIHTFTWTASDVLFQSFYADTIAQVQKQIGKISTSDRVVKQWRYTGKSTPAAGNEKVHLNVWLYKGQAPLNGKEQEIVIKEFKFIPLKNSSLTSE